MTFTKRLREGIRRGEITCSVRIWTRPHITVGKRYRMEDGEIEVDSMTPIGFPDITPELARESGFLGVIDLLKVAKHGTSTHRSGDTAGGEHSRQALRHTYISCGAPNFVMISVASQTNNAAPLLAVEYWSA